MKRVRLLNLKGFTLIEMSVVLIILTILIGSGFSMIGSYLDNAHQTHTKGSLDETKIALLNYVKVNKYMPCPDVDGDGRITDPTDISGNRCITNLGTIPFDDLGLGIGATSDDWGNVFGYGTHVSSANITIMGLDVSDDTAAATLKASPGSYFYKTSAPAFDLDTPPTSSVPGNPANAFTVCRRGGADDCGSDTDKELEYIPAVVVAFGENGGVTDITGCGAGARSPREIENCNADMQLIKGVFRESLYDDQLVTISAYEIKQQVLDILNSVNLISTEDPFGGYEIIIRRDVDSANDLNVDATGDNSFYVEGDFNANVTMSTGVDTLKVTGNVEAGGAPKMGDGDDVLIVDGSLLVGSVTTLGTGDDSATIGGVLAGKLDAGDGNDTVVVSGDVVGEVDMGAGNDDLTVNGEISGIVDGGKQTPAAPDDVDVIRVNQTEADFRASGQESYITRFEIIYFTDGSSALPLP